MPLFVAVWLKMRPPRSWTWICIGPWNFICTFYMKIKQTCIFFFCFFDWSIKNEIIFLYNLYIEVNDKMLWTQYLRSYLTYEPASVAQLDAPSDWRPGGRGFNPRRGRQHSFVEIDHEIFSTVIVSLPLIQEGHLSVSGERMCTILVNRLED